MSVFWGISVTLRVSNGPLETKMPALRAQSALVLNRDLYTCTQCDEAAISARGESLFAIACQIWVAPPEKRNGGSIGAHGEAALMDS
jgi:hypothetical protein